MIFALPLYDDNPIQESPVVTWGLIGMCIGVFLWQQGQNEELVAHQLGMIPAVLFGYRHLSASVELVPPWATVFTSMFMHAGWWHLGGNMLFLWIFGNNIEDLLGRFRYLLLYLGCGAAAALAQALAAPQSTIPMVGASGAVAGVLGAYLITYPHANVHCFVWLFLFFWIMTVPAWVLLGFWFAMQVLSGLARDAGEPGVAFWAHVAGFCAGMLIFLLMRSRRVRLLQPQRSPTWATAPPASLVGRRTFHRGSVPEAGRPWGHGP